MKLIKVLENCTIEGTRYTKGNITLIPITNELAQKLMEEKLIEDILSKVDVPQGQGEVDLSDYTTLEEHNRLNNMVEVQIKGSISALNTNIGEVQDSVNTVKSDVDKNKSSVATLKTDVTKLKGDVTIAQGDISTLKSDMVVVKEKVNAE